jgi:hypothetical protein
LFFKYYPDQTLYIILKADVLIEEEIAAIQKTSTTF